MTLVLVVAIGLAFVIWRIEAAIANAPEQEPELSWLDQAGRAVRGDPVIPCGLRGTIVRVSRADLGMATVRVCPGHSDEGDVKGWWVE